MNPFSKKKRNQSLYDILTPEEIEELKESSAYEKPLSPYVLTKDEIEHEEENKTFFPNISPFEELKKKIIGQEENNDSLQDEIVFSTFSVNTEIFDVEEEEKTEEENSDYGVQLSVFDDITGPYPEEAEENVEDGEQGEVSLFQMCMPFLTDNDGELPKEEPLYILDSVEKILGIEDDDKVEIEEIQLGEEEEVVTTMEDLTKTQVISDIEMIAKTEDAEETQEDTLSFTKTIPVVVTPKGLEHSCEIDISSEILKKTPPKAEFEQIKEADPDEDFIPNYEYTGAKNIKGVRKKLLLNRRNRFLMLFAAVIAFIVVGITAISVQSEKSTAAVVASFIGAAISLFAGYDCVLALPSLFTKRCMNDVIFFFCELFTFSGMVFATALKLSAITVSGLALLLVTNTLARNIFLFKNSLYIYKNFRLATSKGTKHAVSLIDDSPTTFAMAHRAIDGDILVAAAQETDFLKDFIKNSTIDRDLHSLTRIVALASIILNALFSLVIGFYHSDFTSGVIAFSVLSSLFCPFILFGVNTLPLSSACSKLNKLGGAITGVKSAIKLEECNAVALDCDAIFPKGSVKLHTLNILSENNLEETIAIAAAITQTVKSPLYPIFKAATETNSEVDIPVADSIKYEERLGITGWVGDSRVFIGNRALMLAHEIPVGDAQEDKRLLSEGYFPVYLARDGKACALLAVSYEPQKSVTKQLQRITGMGITLLINNCDQNICEEMLCDYFELFTDSVKIMGGSGVHMYKNATAKKESADSFGFLTGKADALAGIIGCSVKIKKANLLLVAACIISIVVGFVFFAYNHFLAASLFISAFDILLFKLATLILTLIAYLFTKP